MIGEVTCVIPARWQSSRFPGKPLALIRGESLISRVYRNAANASGLKDVVVATDDERIFQHCEQNGMRVVYTSEECDSGSARVAEVAQTLESPYLFELQGDQPLVTAEVMDTFLSKCQGEFDRFPAIDVVIPFAECSERDLLSLDVLKVFMDRNQRLLFQTRQPIKTGYRTLGLFLWKRDCLQAFARLPACQIEIHEQSHPLRLYYEGFHVQGVVLPGSDWVEVDREDDIGRVEAILDQQREG